MSVLIAYATKYGTTERIAERVAKEVPGGSVLNVSNTTDASIGGYDIVLVGGPVYAGRLDRHVISFCENHRDELTTRPVAVFVSCLYTGQQAKQQLEESFPPWILSRAFGRYTLGGAVHLDDLSFFHRLIMRGVMKSKDDIDTIDEPEIGRMIAEVRARVAE